MTDAAATTPPPLLSLQGIGKRFGGVKALETVDFTLQSGEIHALLGENGAGKSTLIKILGGIHEPDSGDIFLNGETVRFTSPAVSARAGIRVIHQELALAPNLSIAENLFLGREPGRFGFLDRGKMNAEAVRQLEDLGFEELGDVRRIVGTLSIARQQMVEIARALMGQVHILILDEPTASLSEAETRRLTARLRRLRAQGVGIIYISHRLDEVRQLADRVTVLRDGRSIGTQNAAGLEADQLITWMVGRQLQAHFPRPPHDPGDVVLSVRNLRAPGVHGVSFDLRAGEILGLAGLVGAGRTELARALTGLAPVTSGEMRRGTGTVRFRNAADARAAGIVLVPEDRKREGLIMTQSAGFNIALPWTHLWSRGCFPNRRRRVEIVSRAMTAFGVKADGPDAGVTTLSGGNQQKIVISKWMEHPPAVLILDEPTRGVDVGAREEIFALLAQLVSRRMAVLLISSDLPEVMNLSHRLALYRDGRILREGLSQQFTAEEVMAELTSAREPARSPSMAAMPECLTAL